MSDDVASDVMPMLSIQRISFIVSDWRLFFQDMQWLYEIHRLFWASEGTFFVYFPLLCLKFEWISKLAVSNLICIVVIPNYHKFNEYWIQIQHSVELLIQVGILT